MAEGCAGLLAAGTAEADGLPSSAASSENNDAKSGDTRGAGAGAADGGAAGASSSYGHVSMPLPGESHKGVSKSDM